MSAPSSRLSLIKQVAGLARSSWKLGSFLTLIRLAYVGVFLRQLELLRKILNTHSDLFTDPSTRRLFLEYALCGGALLIIVQATDRMVSILQGRVRESLNDQICDKAISVPLLALQRIPQGEILSLLVNETATVVGLFRGGLEELLANALLMAGLLGYIFWVDPRIGSLALGILSTGLLMGSFFVGRLQGLSSRMSRAAAGVMNFVHESFSSKSVIQVYSQEPRFLEDIKRLGAKYLDASRAFAGTLYATTSLHSIWGGLLVGFLLLFTSRAPQSGAQGWGSVVVLISCVGQLCYLNQRLMNTLSRFEAGLGSYERLESFLSLPEQKSAKLVGPEIHRFYETLRLEGVWYAYQGYEYILKDIQLTIPKGQKVGIFGMTGMGKSSLVNLVTGLVRPVRGIVSMDNIPLEHIPRSSLKRLISVASQDAFLWPRSIFENVNLDQGKLSEDDIEEFLTRHGGEEILRKVGRKPLSGEKDGLSEGEKQLLGLLRALAQKPEILVLDEALSSVDIQREREIVEDILAKNQDLTLIMVSHRFHLMDKMDHVVVLHEGRIVQSGSPKALLESGGPLEKLYRMQSLEDTLTNILKLSVDSVVRDGYPRFHYVRNAILARSLGEKLGLSEPELRELEMAAFLYDIGKINIPDSVLWKTSKLTEKEQWEMEYHVFESKKMALKIAKELKLSSKIADYVFHHHERWDGRGYPKRLKGAEIPLQSRILAVVDTYQAMLADRPYRKAMPKHQVNKHILLGSGKQFDPAVVEALVEVLVNEESRYNSDLQRAQNYEQWLLHQMVQP